MNLSDYLRLIRRRWLFVTTAGVLGVLLAGVVSLLLPPTYKATTQLFVAIQGSGTVMELQQGNTFTQARVESYVRTASTPSVLEPAIESLGLDTSPSELASNIEAIAEPDTVLIRLSASSESPVEAAALAQAVAESLVDVVEELERPSPDQASPVRLSVVASASAPSTPSSPNAALILTAGLLIGLTLGFFLALLRFALDTRIRGEADLRNETNAAILGGITHSMDAEKKPLLTQAGHQSPRAESFRQIRTNLHFATVRASSKALLITSSLPGEGKTTTATNVAIAMAQSGRRVALIDADLRRPMVASYLGLEGNAGLTTVLVGDAKVHEVLQPWGDDQLYVLASGKIPPNPSELLGSREMTELLAELEGAFDVVIVDAPPLIPVTDAAVLAQSVGGVILVVGADKIRSQDVSKALSSLELVKANLLGVILNFLPSKGPDAYAYAYYSYEARSKGREGNLRAHKALNDPTAKGARRPRPDKGKFQDVLG